MSAFEWKVCCIKECERPSVALGLCVNHWRRNKKYGSPVAYKFHPGLMIGKTPEERFWSRVKKGDGCWTWRGGRDVDGYGMFRGQVADTTYHRAHRFSFALHHGPPGRKLVCHKCDNPSCVRPDHLFLGSGADNMADKIAKGRARVPKGEESVHTALTDEQAAAILADARPYVAIAADYGIAPSTVGSIKNRNSWRHIEGEARKARRVSPRKGKSDKLTADDVRTIRESTAPGKTLALRFGISAQTVCDIRKRRSWAHVT